MSKITHKIKSLMAKANDAAATQAEAENALAKAYELLKQHNISMGDLEKGDGAAVEECGEHAWNQRWQKQVWSSVAALYFCEFYYEGNATQPHLYFLIGREANRVTTQSVAQFVVETGKRMAKVYARENEGNSVSLSNNFKKGFAMAIGEKARRLRKEATAQTTGATGTALAVVDVYEATRAENAEFTSNLRTTKGKARLTNPKALGSGYDAGKNVSLSPSVAGSNKPLQLS